ncbi:MAG TPA: hypothetical protein VGN83_28135 [Falsiroseomonas sp.]|jgi:hypothetical protein|nr:hypothetical protein [Falsiroseomonas sp.]
MAEPEASPVPWLGPFRLGPPVLLDGALEVTLPPDALRPFALLRADAATLHFRPEDAGAAALAAQPPAALRAALRQVPAEDPSHAARALRWRLGAALAAVEATEAVQAVGGAGEAGRGWLAAAAERRSWYLRALHAGQPPPAEAVAGACRAVPHGLRHLGKALPTAEALRLLTPLGRICEVGAGFGLFARALERAGLAVAASDADRSGETGIAFPVRKGLDAAATLDWFAARGPVPPLLMVWPQFDEGDWFAEVFAVAQPGQVIALASPELEFCLAGGLAVVGGGALAHAGAGWRAAGELLRLLSSVFEPLGEAPVVAAGWPAVTTPLRLWRRRGTVTAAGGGLQRPP